MARRAILKHDDPSQPKPERVAMALERDIRSGRLGFGDRLQSENELVQRFSVSRMTVRKGLEALADKGLITTRMGIGSFVTFDGQVIDNNLGWTRALAGGKTEVETQVLRIAAISDRKLARQLNHGSSKFIAIDRTRSLKGTGRAISIERSRVPAIPALAHVPRRGLTEGSLSRTLREAGLLGEGGEEWAEIECLTEIDAGILKVAEGTPFLRTRRLVRDADGALIEYVVSLLDPHYFALHLEF
jgi:GntR family transcriptional regulator